MADVAGNVLRGRRAGEKWYITMIPTSSRLNSKCNIEGESKLEKRAATVAATAAGSAMVRATRGSILL